MHRNLRWNLSAAGVPGQIEDFHPACEKERTGPQADSEVNTVVWMRKSLPIFVIVVGLLRLDLPAESIPLAAPAVQTSTVRQLLTGSSCVAGDLGKSFAKGSQLPLSSANRGLPANGIPLGSLVRFSDPWPVSFYAAREAQSSLVNAFSDIFIQTLFERKPKGPRGRRELAEAAARR